jgi:hypothetical protein
LTAFIFQFSEKRSKNRKDLLTFIEKERADAAQNKARASEERAANEALLEQLKALRKCS